MRERAPEQIEALAVALGTDPESIGDRIKELAGGRRGWASWEPTVTASMR